MFLWLNSPRHTFPVKIQRSKIRSNFKNRKSVIHKLRVITCHFQNMSHKLWVIFVREMNFFIKCKQLQAILKPNEYLIVECWWDYDLRISKSFWHLIKIRIFCVRISQSCQIILDRIRYFSIKDAIATWNFTAFRFENSEFQNLKWLGYP